MINTVNTGDQIGIRMRVDLSNGLVSDWTTQTVTPTPTLIPGAMATGVSGSDVDLDSRVQVSWTYPAGVSGTPNLLIQYKGEGTVGPGWHNVPGTNVPYGDDGEWLGSYGYADINIDNGATAQFRVMIPGLAGGGWSEPVSATQPGTAGEAGTVSLTDNGDGTMTFTWGGASDAGYLPTVVDSTGDAVGGNNTYEAAGSGVIPTSPGEKYYALLDTETEGTPGPDNEENVLHGFSQAEYDAPGAPLPNSATNLVIDLTGPQAVTMHWIDNSIDESGFNVYRSDDSMFESDVELVGTTGADTSVFADMLPDRLHEWYYRVYAINSFAATVGAPATSTAFGVGAVPPAGNAAQGANGAQGSPVPSSVGFAGPGSQTIERDNGSGNYNAPQWLDGDNDGVVADDADSTVSGKDNDYPVSYVRTIGGNRSFIIATLTLNLHGAQRNGQIWSIKASSYGIDFQPDFAAATLINNSVTIKSTKPITTTIDNGDLSIDWEMSFDGGKTWSDIGTTTNHVYVTGGRAPVQFETVIAEGCVSASGSKPSGNAAVGTVADEEIAEAIFGRFSGRDTVHVHDGKDIPGAMTYWGKHSGTGDQTDFHTTAGLLKNSDARCGGWTSFLNDCLASQGITCFHSLDVVPAPYPAGKNPAYTATGEELQVNHAAQGDLADKPRQFNDHVFTVLKFKSAAKKVTGEIFDASYGEAPTQSTVTSDTLLAFQWQSPMKMLSEMVYTAQNLPTLIVAPPATRVIKPRGT